MSLSDLRSTQNDTILGEKMELFENSEISNVVAGFYFKSVLAFQQAPVGMFRA